MKAITKISIIALSLTLFGVVLLGTDAANNLFAQTEEPLTPITEEANEQDSNAEGEAIEVYRDSTVVVERINGTRFHLYSQEAVQAGLDTAVSDNVLTKAEADKILAAIESHAETNIHIFEETISALPNLETFVHEGQFGNMTIEMLPSAILGQHGFGGFPGALYQAAQEGILTNEDVDAILTDFADLSGDKVSLEMPEIDAGKNTFVYSINGDFEAIEAAQTEALANAVTNGRLTQAQADEILANSKIELNLIDSGLPRYFEFLDEEGKILEEIIIGEPLEELFESAPSDSDE